MMGSLLLIIGIAGILLYGWLVFIYNPVLILQITAFVAVAAILGIVAWIGYTMATTPPPPETIEVEEATEPKAETPAAPEPSEAEPAEKPSKSRAKKK